MNAEAAKTLENSIERSKQILRQMQEDRESISLSLGGDLLHAYQNYMDIAWEAMEEINRDLHSLTLSALTF